MTATTNLLHAVEKAQIDLIYSTRIYSILSMFAGAVSVYLLMSDTGRDQLGWWLLYMLFVDTYRLYTALLYRRGKKFNTVNELKARKHIYIATVFSGIGWGASAILLFPELGLVDQMFLTAVLVGISTGAITTLAYRKDVAYIFVLLVIVPFIISILLAQSQLYILSVFVFMYMLFLLKNIKVFSENNEKLLYLEFAALEREKELAVQRERAVQANAAKSAFLANISHELRTPMHAILGFSELGINKIDTLPTEKLLTYFTRIQASGQRLLGLLNNLLDISKFEAGRMKLEMQQADILESIDIVTEELAPLFVQREQCINLDVKCENTRATYDDEKIVQVIRNLLSNAIKFTGKDCCITILVEDAVLESAETGSSEAALSVSVIDEGDGVPEAELETIFDKFVQSSRTDKEGGTGLGLSICYEIIRMHAGRISAANDPDGGAVFRFVIPRDSAPSLAEAG